MDSKVWNEKLEERRVTYTLESNGQLIVVENVPARVNIETGEQLFSPDTVERLQKMIGGGRKPKRVIQVPVYEFA
jgi:YgiT-type zinc finger domain-containing protein